MTKIMKGTFYHPSQAKMHMSVGAQREQNYETDKTVANNLSTHVQGKVRQMYASAVGSKASRTREERGRGMGRV